MQILFLMRRKLEKQFIKWSVYVKNRKLSLHELGNNQKYSQKNENKFNKLVNSEGFLKKRCKNKNKELIIKKERVEAKNSKK